MAGDHPQHSADRFRNFSCLSLLVFALSFFSSAHALDPDKAITQYVHDVWQTEQGLPQNSVHAIVQTRDGYLWLATEEGLVRFDGVRFVVFDKTNTKEMRSNYLQSLFQDRNGNLWIGADGGLNRFRDGKFTSYTTKEGLLNDTVHTLYEDREGNLWIGTNGGLSRFRDGKFVSYTTREGLSTDLVRSLYGDREGNLWIGTRGGGLSRFKDGRFTTYTSKEGLSNDIVHSLFEDREGNLWIGTEGGGLNRFKDGKFTNYTTKEGLSNDSVWSIYEDRERNLWIGTEGGGLNRLKDGKLTSYATREGLSNDFVLSSFEDREGNLWIGTHGGGLNRFKDGKFTSYATSEGLSNDIVWSVYEDREKNLWIGTNGRGLNNFKDGKFTNYTTRDGLSNDFIFSLYADRDANLWIGTDGGLNRFKNGNFANYTTRDGLSSDSVFSMNEDSEGDLWIGTDKGLNRLKDGKLTTYTTKDGLSNDTIYFLHGDREGNLWIATDGGLSRYKDGEFRTYTSKDGLSIDFVRSLYEDRQGNLWIGTNGGGLNRFKDGRFTNFTTRNGLFDDLVLAILEDRSENLWMSCNKGIFRVSKKQLNDFADGKIQSITSVRYDISDGMKSSECNGGAQPAGWKTQDGKLWFATIKGAVMIDPENIKLNEQPPPVIIEQLTADNTVFTNTLAAIDLPPGSDKLEFHYAGLSLVTPEKVQFQYKLEGYDREWVEAGTRRVAYYTHLDPGRYTFRVKACNNDGVWNEAGASFAFYLQPLFYQTGWFYGLCGIAAAAAIGAGYGFRIRQLKAREKELTNTVDEKTVELRRANERLQESNQKLEEAQDRITRLLDANPQGLEDISGWCLSVVQEIGRIIGAAEFGVWVVEEDHFNPLVPTTRKPPTMEELKSGASNIFVSNPETVVPVTGLSGEIYGALRVSGRNILWSETERRLVCGFAHQLGGALEMQEMRKQLASAQREGALTLQQMHERGIATLQVCPTCGCCYDHTFSKCPQDGSRLKRPRVLPYKILDRYRFEQLVGQGGMGTVYKALDEKLQRFVAVKIINAELLNDPLIKARLEREAHLVARLNHPGIIDIHDFGELRDGSAFIVMEFLEGLDLAELMKVRGPGTPSQVAVVLSQAGDALGSAHFAGVVHRDLKPANLFLIAGAQGFQTKVVDFGLAKTMGEEITLTRTGMLIGSPAYMSPEQVRQQPLDERSDLFSLASVTYELLTGTLAFDGADVTEVLLNVMTEDPPPLSTKLTSIDQDLDQAFHEAFQKDRDKRPRSIALWARKVTSLLEGAVSPATGWHPIVFKNTSTT